MKDVCPSIKVAFLASVNRAQGVDECRDTVDLAIKAKQLENGQNLVGLELSGDPRVGDFEAFKSQFQTARDNGLKISLHCAEIREQQQESDSMIEFKPDRLGHCCYLDSVQINKVHHLGIPVEICPSSNVATV